MLFIVSSRPPRSPLFPYTTLFRSEWDIAVEPGMAQNASAMFTNGVVDIAEAFCAMPRSEEHTSELQSRPHLVCRLLLEKKKKTSIMVESHRSIKRVRGGDLVRGMQ